MPYKGYKGSITKRHFITLLAHDIGIRKSDAGYIINRLFGILIDSMRRGERISFEKFGNFEPVIRKGGRRGFDFKNGRHLPPYPSVVEIEFRPGSETREIVRKLPLSTVKKL